MQKKGDKSTLDTFIQTSSVISQFTPYLGLELGGSSRSEDEIMKNVQIRIIPLQWIMRGNGSLTKLYQFLKDNDLQGSILQEAIFDSLWKIEQPKIIGFVFLPYMIYFIVSNFYFYECMLDKIDRPISVFASYCDPKELDCIQQTIEPTLRYIFMALLAH